MARLTDTDKKQVTDWVNFWAGKLQLTRFNIQIAFRKRRDPNADSDTTVFADVVQSYAGLDTDLNIWLPFWSLPDTQREKVCLHELIHVLIPSANEPEICAVTEVIWSIVKGNMEIT